MELKICNATLHSCDFVSKYDNLVVLVLSSNLLTIFPSLKLPLLEHLDLSNNQLTKVEAGFWPRLKMLNLRFNNLNDLPTELVTCTNLLVVDIRNNQFPVIPPVLFSMLDHLKVVKLLDL